MILGSGLEAAPLKETLGKAVQCSRVLCRFTKYFSIGKVPTILYRTAEKGELAALLFAFDFMKQPFLSK